MLFNNPSAAASAIARGGLHCERSFIDPALIADLRKELRTSDLRVAESYRSDGSRDDLRKALSCRPNMNEGRFYELYDKLDESREQLADNLGVKLSPGIEATFVIYPPGGFYRRHVDSLSGADPDGSGRRAISFICYLNAPSRPWTPEDGGALRCFQDERDDAAEVEVLPESGLLVAFDSKRLWHEVMPTRRERTCLVGWFRSE